MAYRANLRLLCNVATATTANLWESNGEDGTIFIYNATVHVPLIVKPPAGRGFQRAPSTSVETAAVARLSCVAG